MRYLLLTLMLVCGPLWGKPAVFASDSRHVSLLELYTSEGCSSCPPAEAWLSGLRDRPGLWRSYVPVAFHVDYWDYLGWKDRFDDPRFGARQRAYAAFWGNGAVYTPAFVVNGRRWQGGALSERLLSPPVRPYGRLRARFDDGTLRIHYRVPAGDRRFVAHVAVLGFGLSSRVRAGENRGRLLTHDFVVLSYRRVSLRAKGGAEYDAILRETSVRSRGAKLGLAVWVSAVGSPVPIQAVGGYLPER